jgi:hypothetical protein
MQDSPGQSSEAGPLLHVTGWCSFRQGTSPHPHKGLPTGSLWQTSLAGAKLRRVLQTALVPLPASACTPHLVLQHEHTEQFVWIVIIVMVREASASTPHPVLHPEHNKDLCRNIILHVFSPGKGVVDLDHLVNNLCRLHNGVDESDNTQNKPRD